MFKERKFVIMAAGTAAILLGSTILAIIALPKLNKKMPLADQVVPQDALMAIAVTTDGKEWEKLKEFGTSESRANLDRVLNDWRDRLLTANGYNYPQDIQPWVGGQITFALVPTNPMASSSSNSALSSVSPSVDLVAVLPIADPLKAKEILTKPRNLPGIKLVERMYKNITITETQGKVDRNFSFAVLDNNYLLVTDSSAAVNKAIDTFKGGPAITQTPGYQDAINQIKPDLIPFAQLYINTPVATRIAALNSTRPIPLEQLEKNQTNQGFATSVSLVPDGLNFQAISWLNPQSSVKLSADNTAGQILTRLPNNTIMMLSGSNLQTLWNAYAKGADANPIAPVNPELLRRNMKSATGLDLEQDLVNWMGGEFALSLLPVPPENKANSPFAAGLLLMVKASDRRMADESLQRLDTMMKNQKFIVKEEQVNDQPVITWTSPYGGYHVTRGWLEGNVAFMAFGGAIAKSITPKPPNLLAESIEFQQATPTKLPENSGQFFIDVERGLDPKNLGLSDLLPPSQRMWIEGIKSIGVTVAITGDKTTRYDTFVKLKKADTPTTIPSSSATPLPSPSPSKP